MGPTINVPSCEPNENSELIIAHTYAEPNNGVCRWQRWASGGVGCGQ